MDPLAHLFPRFAFLDIETTGLDFERDEVIEMALVYVENGVRVGEKSWLVRPSQSIPPFITTLTGLTDADVEHAQSFAALQSDFRSAIDGWTLVAHNASFERGFLGALIDGFPMLDSCELSHLLFPELPSHSLDALIRWTGVGRGARHRALADAEDTFAVVSRLLLRAKTSLSLSDIHTLIQCLSSQSGSRLQALVDLLAGLEFAVATIDTSAVDFGQRSVRPTLAETRLSTHGASQVTTDGIQVFEADDVDSARQFALRIRLQHRPVFVAVSPAIIWDVDEGNGGWRSLCPTQHQRLLAVGNRSDALQMAHAYAWAALNRCGSRNAVPAHSWFSARFDLVRALIPLLTDCACADKSCVDDNQWETRMVDCVPQPTFVTHDFAHALLQRCSPIVVVVVGFSDFQRAGVRRHSLQVDVASLEALADLASEVEPHSTISHIFHRVAMLLESALADSSLRLNVPFESAFGDHPAVHRLRRVIQQCHQELKIAWSGAHHSALFAGRIEAWMTVFAEFGRMASPGSVTVLRSEKTGLCLWREPEAGQLAHLSPQAERSGEVNVPHKARWEVSHASATQ